MPLLIVQTAKAEVAEKLANQLMKKSGLQVKYVDFTEGSDKADKPKKVTLKTPKPEELKSVLTEVKEELGVDALKDLLTAHDAKNLKTLNKEEWPTIFAEAKNLLDEANDLDGDDDDDDLGLGDDDDDDDLGLGDDDDDDDLGMDDDDGSDVIDTAYVKKLASQYSSKHGIDEQRAVLEKFGIPTARSLGKADDIQLAKITKALLKGLK